MPLYESVFVARQDISAQQVDGLTETLSALVKENGGVLTAARHICTFV